MAAKKAAKKTVAKKATAKKVSAKKVTKKKSVSKKLSAELGQIDVVFVVDVTGSMGAYIIEARKMAATIMKKIQADGDLDIRAALAVYRDHPPQDFSFVSKGHDFVSIDEITALLNQYQAEGGGDHPEAVYDGLNEVFSFSWRDNADRVMYLIGDAPPHTNCFCQLTPAKLIEKLKEKNIEVNAHSIAGDAITTEAFKEFVDATGGKITTGNKPAYTTAMYDMSLSSKSSSIGKSRGFIDAVITTAGSYGGAKTLTSLSISDAAASLGISEAEAEETVSYLNKRGM